MWVSYLKLREIIRIYDLTHEEIRIKAEVTTTEMAKIKKDVWLTLESAVRISKALTELLKKPVTIYDIMDFKED